MMRAHGNDLKSFFRQRECGFKSHPGHHVHCPSGKRLQVTETLSNGAHSDNNLDTAYTFDNEGKATSVSYPNGLVYTNSFDSMSLSGLKDQHNTTDVSGVSYNAANQLLGFTSHEPPSRIYGHPANWAKVLD